MSLKHHFLSAAYYPLRITNDLLRQVGCRSTGRLRVLLYHAIAPCQEVCFEAQLRWLSRSWQFVGPNMFAAMVTGEVPVRQDTLLLTFDDGFASNRRIAENVLDPMGISAMFFVVSEFMSLSGKDDWRGFVSRHIYPSMKPEEIPSDWRNMTWDDLGYLLRNGHGIGCHTSHHARLSQIAVEDLQAEIVTSADVMERRLGVKVEHFAYPFGDLASFSCTALAAARARFKYIYTGLRGDNARGVPSWAIRRDAMAASDSLSLIGALVEGGADRPLYSGRLAEYESWGRSA